MKRRDFLAGTVAASAAGFAAPSLHGQAYMGFQAWRRNVSGITKGPLPFFWGVSKT
jgi:hypothetical protein